MRSKKLIKWLEFIVAAALLFGAARLYYHLTDDFRMGNITYPNMPYHPSSPSQLTSTEQLAELEPILAQKFHYMDKGAQSYAFVSEDGEYVLKFFKFKNLKPHWAVEFLPRISPFKHYVDDYCRKKEKKLAGLFEGYEIAWQYNQKGAELIYLHLTPTDYLKNSLTITDKIGLSHTILLDQMIFLLQKKGIPLRAYLKELLNQGQIEEAQGALASILAMYVSEYEKGIYDRDHGVMQNTGFIDKRPFHLDVGKMSRDETFKSTGVYKSDLELVIWKMDRWLNANYPQDYPTLSNFLAAEYQRITGEKLNIAYITPEIAKSRRR